MSQLIKAMHQLNKPIVTSQELAAVMYMSVGYVQALLNQHEQLGYVYRPDGYFGGWSLHQSVMTYTPAQAIQALKPIHARVILALDGKYPKHLGCISQAVSRSERSTYFALSKCERYGLAEHVSPRGGYIRCGAWRDVVDVVLADERRQAAGIALSTLKRLVDNHKRYDFAFNSVQMTYILGMSEETFRRHCRRLCGAELLSAIDGGYQTNKRAVKAVCNG